MCDLLLALLRDRLQLLWAINISILRWVLLGVTVVFTGATLALALWPAFTVNDSHLCGFITVGIAVVAHCLLAILFKVC